jgi:hypothetical protein
VGESEREESLLRDLCFVGEKYGSIFVLLEE